MNRIEIMCYFFSCYKIHVIHIDFPIVLGPR